MVLFANQHGCGRCFQLGAPQLRPAQRNPGHPEQLEQRAEQPEQLTEQLEQLPERLGQFPEKWLGRISQLDKKTNVPICISTCKVLIWATRTRG